MEWIVDKDTQIKTGDLLCTIETDKAVSEIESPANATVLERIFMNKKYDIMVAGHVCFDLIPRFKDSGAKQIQEIMTPGKLVNIDECMLSTGGPVSNTGIGMQKLGNSVSFSARIGDDEFGRMTSEFLSHLGNADGIKIANNQTSSYTIALAPPNIDRIFLHNRLCLMHF